MARDEEGGLVNYVEPGIGVATDTYEEVLRRKAAGRLPDAKLIFPNVELRLDVATAKGGFVNLHLFVSPEDPNHLEELRRLLSRLRISFG
jgi:hypothetical protein